MKKEIEDILEDLLQASRDPLFQKLDILDITSSVIKARLMIKGDLFIQIYENVRKPKCSYALIIGNDRFYGRDMRENSWHRHPIHNPESHNDSGEATRSINMLEFIDEVKEILIQQNLI